MSNKLKIGEVVRHNSHGKGVIKGLFSQGIAEVKFRNSTHYVELRNLISLDQKKREAEARREEARQAALRREAEQQEKLRQENLRLEAEAKRAEPLRQIRRQLRTDFLGADSFFKTSCSDVLSVDEYEQEKIAFVKNWIADHTPPENNGKKRSPDDEQASAIAAVHGHIQVVARAGSGKTATLVSRAQFLQKHCGVKPSEMLLMTFNKKAAEEMENRLGQLLDGQPPYVMTFHALAHALVHPEQNLIHDSSDGRSPALSRFVQAVIDDHLKKPEFVGRIRKLMVAHFREDWDKIEAGGYHLNMEEMLQYRRSLQRETLNGDFVKSFGEKLIANCLFENQIRYLYERPEKGGLKNYRPDFKLLRRDRTGVIIEYFGLAGDPDYDAMSEGKRDYWEKKHDWTLIEFTPEDIRKNGVEGFQTLMREVLEKEGFTFKRLSEEEIWHRIRQRCLDRFTAATCSFIARCRKLELTPDTLALLIERNKFSSQIETDFLNIVQSLYTAYLERLDADEKEDFDGLMHRAAQAVRAGNTSFSRFMKKQHGDLRNLRFMLIDEYQDFSKLFHSLINATCKQNPKLELFCVGDDWQAINGFAGSDLQYYLKFSDYFPSSRKLNISTNYRSSTSIVNIGNTLMLGQGQPAEAHALEPGHVWLADVDEFPSSRSENARHVNDNITPMVLRIAAKALNQGKDVVLLSRTNRLPWDFDYSAFQEDVRDTQATEIVRFGQMVRSFFHETERSHIKVSTTHSFKGLQGKVVVVLDAVAGCYPLIHQDWIFMRVLGESIAQITDESRRLFYVALTRAVETLVIFTAKQKKSPFLQNIEKQMRLTPIRWKDFPPVSAQSERLIVMVGNQPDRGSTPTTNIKDLLKQEGYRYSNTRNWPCWVRGFPAEGFSVELLQNSNWSSNANGVEIRVVDEQDNLVKQYAIDEGVWR